MKINIVSRSCFFLLASQSDHSYSKKYKLDSHFQSFFIISETFRFLSRMLVSPSDSQLFPLSPSRYKSKLYSCLSYMQLPKKNLLVNFVLQRRAPKQKQPCCFTFFACITHQNVPLISIGSPTLLTVVLCTFKIILKGSNKVFLPKK